MKAIIAAAAAVAAIAAAAPAVAQVSGSVGYTRFNTDAADLDAVTGRVGWAAGPVGVEAEGTFGVGDDNGIELKHDVAAYAKVQAPIGETVNVFARVGYGTTEIEGNGLPGTAFDDESLRYGAGAEFFFDGLNGVRGDWTRYDLDNGDLDTWSVSFVRRF